jgi:hypothetical protein
MVTQVNQITISQSIIKQARRAIIIPFTTMFLIEASDQVKIPKQKPIIMSISFRKIRYKFTSHWLMLGFGITIETSGSPAVQIIITLHITINHSFIKSIDLKLYIISPAYSQTSTPIIVRQRAINRKNIRVTVTKRIGFC